MATDYTPIARKLRAMIRKEIKDYGLIDTGAMYDSITVYVEDIDNYYVEAVDYFKYWDENYGITEKVYNSDAFNKFVYDFYVAEVERILNQ